MKRIEQIDRAMKELAECRAAFATCFDPLLPLLGQMDWLQELHRLVHEVR